PLPPSRKRARTRARTCSTTERKGQRNKPGGVVQAAPFLFCSFPKLESSIVAPMAFGLLRIPLKPAGQPVELREHRVAGRTLPLRIVENERARRLPLRIDAGGRGLRVTVPPGLRQGEVEKFLDRHRGWLEQRLAQVPERPQVRPGIKIPLRGVPHLIVHEPGSRGTVEIARDATGPILIVRGDRLHLPRR